MERLRTTIQRGHLLLDLDAHSVREIFEQAARLAAEQGLAPAALVPDVVAELWRREERISTAIGHAVAVPHAYLPGLADPVILFLRLKHPLNMGAPDGIPTRFLFVLLGPPDHAAEHLDTLTMIARLMSDEEFRYEADLADDGAALVSAIDRFIARDVPPEQPLPAAPDELEWTGRLCGGLAGDIRRRAPDFVADFRDALRLKTLNSVIFLYFACLAPAVTFGGLMSIETGGEIGAAEMLVATAVGGSLFALCSGQPLIILGGIGPLLVFTGILYRLCGQFQVPFLPSYAWVGLWMCGFTVLLAVTDASCLIRYFTRFTDEIFAALISMIFVVEAMRSIVGYLREAHAATVSHDVAFLALILSLGTFIVAMLLSRFRRSRYLRPLIREFLADFGPTIAILAMILFAAMFPQVRPDAVNVPDQIGTSTGRPWFVSLTDVPVWVRFAAAVPALLGTVLVFLDQNITARLVNSPEHHLRKGTGYHLDLAVVGVLLGLCSLAGLPWLVAATVRSLNHVRSLATVEEVVAHDGSTCERIIHVLETRLSGVCIHVLIGLSLLFLPQLKTVPLAVLYGLFLYMGIVSMGGNQFLGRLSLWLTDPDLYPQTHYLRRVPRPVVHAFTMLQLSCLVVLWFIQASVIGILFPLFIALLVPLRFVAGRFFSPSHLTALDADEDPEEEESTWV